MMSRIKPYLVAYDTPLRGRKHCFYGTTEEVESALEKLRRRCIEAVVLGCPKKGQIGAVWCGPDGWTWSFEEIQ